MTDTSALRWNTANEMNGLSDTEDAPVSLIKALIRGEDGGNWQLLLSRIHKLALHSCTAKQSSRGPDFANDVALRCIERMHAGDYKTLRRFLQHRRDYPSLTFETWARGIINNCIVDQLRSLPTLARKRGVSGRRLTPRFHVAYQEAEHSSTVHEGAAQVLDLRRILAWIRDTKFPPKQREILMHWLHGYSIGECSQLLNIDEPEAQRLLRAARRRLRRKFEEKL